MCIAICFDSFEEGLGVHSEEMIYWVLVMDEANDELTARHLFPRERKRNGPYISMVQLQKTIPS